MKQAFNHCKNHQGAKKNLHCVTGLVLSGICNRHQFDGKYIAKILFPLPGLPLFYFCNPLISSKSAQFIPTSCKTP